MKLLKYLFAVSFIGGELKPSTHVREIHILLEISSSNPFIVINQVLDDWYIIFFNEFTFCRLGITELQDFFLIKIS